MFKNILDSITDKEEKTRTNNLLEELKLQEERLLLALEAEVSFVTVLTHEQRYKSIAKKINSLLAKYGIDERVKEDHKIEIERANKNFAPRDRQHETEISSIKDQSSDVREDSDKVSLGAYSHGTPSLPQKKVPSLNLEKLQIDSLADGSFVTSTPRSTKVEVPRVGEFPTPKHCLQHIKQELPKEIPSSHVESYLEEEENLAELIGTVKQGFRLPNILQIVKDNILRFVGQKEELSDLIREETPLLSALDTFLISEEEDTIVTMPNTLDMRGLSVKDALDLIPRYNGANIPLTQFLDGCTEAQSILPEGAEENFMKFIRIRLYGEALNIARSHSFKTLRELSEFFEKMFGSAKTYYDLTGELAKVKQGRNETVVLYLNRVKEIEKEIRKAAQKEGRITNEAAFNDDLNRDCLKYFMRGLRWEIKARMGTPSTYEKAQEDAIETEREFACSIFDDPTEKEKREEKPKSPKDVRRVNIVEPQQVTFTCWYCNKPGHTMARCFALERNRRAWGPRGNFNPSRNFVQPRPQQDANAWGWNARNTRQVSFLPEQNDRAHGFSPPPSRGNMRPAPDFPRGFNGPFPRNADTGPSNFSRGRPGNVNEAVRGNFAPRNTAPITCYYCGLPGHVQRDCRSYQRAANQEQRHSGNLPNLSQAGAMRETPPPARSSLPQRENAPRPTSQTQ